MNWFFLNFLKYLWAQIDELLALNISLCLSSTCSVLLDMPKLVLQWLPNCFSSLSSLLWVHVGFVRTFEISTSKFTPGVSLSEKERRRRFDPCGILGFVESGFYSSLGGGAGMWNNIHIPRVCFGRNQKCLCVSQISICDTTLLLV